MRFPGAIAFIGAAQAQDACPPPPSVSYASFDYVTGSNTAAYSCQAGFCFENERTRTLDSSCAGGEWSEVPACKPCSACVLPQVDANQNINWNVDDWSATISCVEEDAVLEPGTDVAEMKISCIENGKWNKNVPVCSRPSKVTCGDDHIEVVVDKALFRAKGWDASTSNVFLAGPGSNLMSINDVDNSCFATEDADGNYRVRIEAPFMGQCGTQASIEDSDYIFANKIKWRVENDFTVKDAEVLDFKCNYKGVFMAGLPQLVKLAINTKTYSDPSTEEDFTVSMSVYDRANYTGLVDNIPLLHRGKRYFVDLHLHNREIGTPFLKYCYGSKNYVSESELREKYKTETSSSGLRSMVVNGCPASGTLVRLEQSPTTYQSRYSFMFPKIGIQGRVDLQFVYLHCEIEIKPLGFAPKCDDTLFEQVLRRNFASINGANGNGPFSNKFGPRFQDQAPAGSELIAGRSMGGGSQQSRTDAIWDINCKIPLFKSAPQCVQRANRNRRSAASAAGNMAVGFGPIVFPEDEESEIDETVVVEEVLKSSKLFVEETLRVEDIIAEQALELDSSVTTQIEQIEVLRQQRKTRKCLIIGGMAFTCFFLFFLSLLISSRVSCFTKSKKSKSGSDILADQIQKELNRPSKI